MKRWLGLLAPGRALRTCLFVAALLCAPSWLCGFFADDDFQIAMLEKGMPEIASSPLDLYGFSRGNPALTQSAIAHGTLPWWTDPHIKINFFRPLSSFLIAVDHTLFGRDPVPYHLHSWLWYLGLVAVAWHFFRRVLPGIAGGLALFVFAVDDCHVMSFAWLASRHAELSALFSIAGLIFHLRFREDRWRPGQWLAPIAFAAGLLCGEGALGIIAYLFAYEIAGRASGPMKDGATRDSLRARVLATVPTVALVLLYLVNYKRQGYGAAMSSAYIDPIAEPARFIVATLSRTPVLVEDLLGGVSADSWLFVPQARPLLIAAGIGTAGGVALCFRSFWPRLSSEEQNAAKWLPLGALLALLPAMSGFVGARVLVPASLGGAGILAILIRHGWLAAREGVDTNRLARIACTWLAFVHMVLSPILVLVGIAALIKIRQVTHEAVARPELSEKPGLEIFILSASDPMIGFYAGPALFVRPGSHPGPIRLLSMAPQNHSAVRTGPSSFELRTENGGRFFDSEYEGVFRRLDVLFHEGDEVSLGDAIVRVVELRDGKPVRIEVTTAKALDDPGYAFVAWHDGALETVVFPPEGVVVPLPRSPGPAGL